MTLSNDFCSSILLPQMEALDLESTCTIHALFSWCMNDEAWLSPLLYDLPGVQRWGETRDAALLASGFNPLKSVPFLFSCCFSFLVKL